MPLADAPPNLDTPDGRDGEIPAHVDAWYPVVFEGADVDAAQWECRTQTFFDRLRRVSLALAAVALAGAVLAFALWSEPLRPRIAAAISSYWSAEHADPEGDAAEAVPDRTASIQHDEHPIAVMGWLLEAPDGPSRLSSYGFPRGYRLPALDTAGDRPVTDPEPALAQIALVHPVLSLPLSPPVELTAHSPLVIVPEGQGVAAAADAEPPSTATTTAPVPAEPVELPAAGVEPAAPSAVNSAIEPDADIVVYGPALSLPLQPPVIATVIPVEPAAKPPVSTSRDGGPVVKPRAPPPPSDSEPEERPAPRAKRAVEQPTPRKPAKAAVAEPKAGGSGSDKVRTFFFEHGS